jgi:hypothetical protein
MCIAGGNKIAWCCIGLYYNAVRYCHRCWQMAASGGGVFFTGGFPLKLYAEFLLWLLWVHCEGGSI